MKNFITFILFVLATITTYSQTFDKYDTKEFIRLGGKVIVGNQFDKYDIKEILSAQ